jgi:LacI family transcriptional regulator
MVTTRQIAREVGLSHVTVAAALKNSKKCAPATRERVLEAATRLGWRPNPLVEAFQKAVAKGGLPEAVQEIAWIVDIPHAENLWQIPAAMRAATARAAGLGFRLRPFSLQDYGFDSRSRAHLAFERVLHEVRSRGIRSAIIPIREYVVLRDVQSLANDDLAIVLLLDDGSAVRSVKDHGEREVYHRVTSDVFFNVRSAVVELMRLGYRRIGLCLSEWRDAATAGEIRAGYYAAGGDAVHAEPCFIEAVPPPIPTSPSKEFAKWLDRGKFDAVLCGNTQIHKWITSLGYSIPRDIGLAHFELGPAEAGWSGIDPQIEAITASAVDLVVSHLLRNETGRPTFTKALSVEGRWVPGRTTKRQVGPAAPAKPKSAVARKKQRPTRRS